MSEQKESQYEVFNIKEFILVAYSSKYFYIASFFICISVALFFNKISPFVYEVNSVIGPVVNKQSSLLGSGELFGSLGAFGETRNLENDINSLNSFNIVSTTIKNLNLEVGYYTEKNKFLGQSRQIYMGSPYSVSIDKSHIQPLNGKFYIKIIDDTDRKSVV